MNRSAADFSRRNAESSNKPHENDAEKQSPRSHRFQRQTKHLQSAQNPVGASLLAKTPERTPDQSPGDPDTYITQASANYPTPDSPPVH
ncbi:hypothetical protein, partial [Pseudomonas sp. HMWF006]|uniref:hypothetical protein n=1 Tax=Pseudomonas sp. HMWF006 TaxID=2056843 RepID=UPI001C440A22